jgi:O-antigen/teichoic acid export membrane protein
MSNTHGLAKTATKAGFNYLWGLVISTVISSIGTIYISAVLLSPDEYGLYGFVFILPTMIALFRDWGINQATIRYTAQHRAENRETKLRSIFIISIAFEIALGLTLFAISFFTAGHYAVSHEHPEAASLIQIASFTIIANGLITAASSIFTGIEKTVYYSIMLICQSIVKTFLMITLVMMGFGALGAITGFTIASVIAGLIGIAFVISLYCKIPKPSPLQPSKLDFSCCLKEMLKYGMPLSFSAILLGFFTQFCISYLSELISYDILGNYNFALNFVVLISFFSLPITNMLFPAFSKLDIKKDKLALKQAFQLSVKYSALIVIPVATIIMCLSTQAITTLSADKYPSAPLFLTLIAGGYLLSAIGNLSINNLLNSQGQTKLNLKLAILTAAIGFPMGYLLISCYTVIGLIFTSIVAPIPSLILSIVWVKKRYELTIDWVSSGKILFSSAITAILTYIMVNFIHPLVPTIEISIWRYLFQLNSLFELIMGTGFFLVVLIGVLMLTRTLSMYDLNNLRNMTTNLGPLTKVIHLILNIMENIMKKLKLI